ncbi:CRISPR-associated endonuclease Cas2 [Sulfurovum indicum]|uniref:CRISPR-associated endoribonuclease Cas2 n=2 Tax=Sulfurovaceae TaxID=2771472 RepID=A0A7M1S6U1_9BACT|nr:CRISPR-associated endonuclease Cas2 [Sulfurovum indicum]
MDSYESRFMRLFVFFDLPTGTKKERSHATRFRNMLIKNGFTMLQFSVYVRVCKGQDMVSKYLDITMKHLPPKGHIRAMQVTDKQYERMHILIGEETVEEKNVGVQQLLLF